MPRTPWRASLPVSSFLSRAGRGLRVNGAKRGICRGSVALIRIVKKRQDSRHGGPGSLSITPEGIHGRSIIIPILARTINVLEQDWHHRLRFRMDGTQGKHRVQEHGAIPVPFCIERLNQRRHRFGSLWTNIPHGLFTELGIDYGKRVEVAIRNDTRELYRNTMVYARSFAEVNVGEPLVYINSILNVAVAINQGSFSRAYSIGTGLSWKLSLRKAPRIVYE